jgi:hypothetical protein
MPLLFSYGTLQQRDVQLATFGRLLDGEPDELVGFALTFRSVDDAAFVRASGRRDHAVVTFTGGDESRVPGTIYAVSEDELARADAYEPAGWARVHAPLASGREAWVYADARGA